MHRLLYCSKETYLRYKDYEVPSNQRCVKNQSRLIFQNRPGAISNPYCRGYHVTWAGYDARKNHSSRFRDTMPRYNRGSCEKLPAGYRKNRGVPFWRRYGYSIGWRLCIRWCDYLALLRLASRQGKRNLTKNLMKIVQPFQRYMIFNWIIIIISSNISSILLSGYSSCGWFTVILRENESCPPRVPCSWSENEHTVSSERVGESEIPEREGGHLLHWWESTVVSVPTESEPCSEVAQLSWLSLGKWTKHSIGYTVKTSGDKTSHSSSRFRYSILYIGE